MILIIFIRHAKGTSACGSDGDGIITGYRTGAPTLSDIARQLCTPI